MDIRWLHSHHEEPLVLQAGRPLQQVQLCWDQSGDEPGTRQVQGNLQQGGRSAQFTNSELKLQN